MTFAIIGALLVGGCLGLLGSGGSILIVPVLVYLVGHGEKAAVVESLAVVGIIAAYGTCRRAMLGQVDWRSGWLFAIGSAAGAYAGSQVGVRVSGTVQLVVLAVLMLGAATLMIRGKGAGEGTEGSARWVLALAGVVVGLITGLVGIGGGFLIVPTLVVLGGLTMQRAVGTSLGLITVNCVFGLIGYLSAGGEGAARVDWTTVGVFAAVGIVGATAGQFVSGRVDQKALKRMFGWFVLALGIWMIMRESGIV